MSLNGSDGVVSCSLLLGDNAPIKAEPPPIRLSKYAGPLLACCDSICQKVCACVTSPRLNALTSRTISTTDHESDTTLIHRQRYTLATKPCCTCSLNLARAMCI